MIYPGFFLWPFVKVLTFTMLIYSLPSMAVKIHEPSTVPSEIYGDTVRNITMMFFINHGRQNDMDLYGHPYFKNHDGHFQFLCADSLPDGFIFSEKGILTWAPTADQFLELNRNARSLRYSAVGLDGSSLVMGEIRLVAQGDLVQPPEKPQEKTAEIKEGPVDTSVQEAPSMPIQIRPPSGNAWRLTDEGASFSFNLSASGGSGNYIFELQNPEFLMSNLDKYGHFEWRPDYDIVTPLQEDLTIPLTVKVMDDQGNDTTQQVYITVQHVNRPPMVDELPAFYIQYDKLNKYDLNAGGLIYDADGDSIIFKPIIKELPQEMKMSTQGIITWKPSVRQFRNLRDNPLYLTFTVEDYPYGDKTVGQIKIVISQQDLPPQIIMIPNKTQFDIEENEDLKINFFITDPNGSDNILRFDFVSENSELSSDLMINKGEGQYEFSWTPGFNFIQEPGSSKTFEINFFAIDVENNRTEQIIGVKVMDTENLLEKDRILYDQYRTVLEGAWELIQQLDEKEAEKEKEYKRAKKGKKNRAIGTASVGALTGLSPVIFVNDPSGQKILAGVGGTATATIGTLEASNVIGESPSEIMRTLGNISQKKNDLLVYGNVFAARYALPLNRRDNSFASELKSLTIHLNLKDVHQLELDAAWENTKKATDKNIKKIFKDFNPDPRFTDFYKSQ